MSGAEASTSEAESSESSLIRRPRRPIVIEEASEEEMSPHRRPTIKDLSALAFGGLSQASPAQAQALAADRAPSPPLIQEGEQQPVAIMDMGGSRAEKRPRTEAPANEVPEPIEAQT